MEDEPILTRREKGGILKLAMGLIALVVAGPYLAGALAIGVLLLIGTIGLIAGFADWFLWYGLPTLGVFVVCVLVLRWLFAPEPTVRAPIPRRSPKKPEPPIEAELEVLRVRVAETGTAIVPRRQRG